MTYRENADLSMPATPAERRADCACDVLAAVVLGLVMFALSLAYCGVLRA
jgi:hypothetical protein